MQWQNMRKLKPGSLSASTHERQQKLNLCFFHNLPDSFRRGSSTFLFMASATRKTPRGASASIKTAPFWHLQPAEKQDEWTILHATRGPLSFFFPRNILRKVTFSNSLSLRASFCSGIWLSTHVLRRLMSSLEECATFSDCFASLWRVATSEILDAFSSVDFGRRMK